MGYEHVHGEEAVKDTPSNAEAGAFDRRMKACGGRNRLLSVETVCRHHEVLGNSQ